MFSKKEFGIVSNLRFISMKNFMLSWVEHEKSFNLGAWLISAGLTCSLVENAVLWLHCLSTQQYLNPVKMSMVFLGRLSTI